MLFENCLPAGEAGIKKAGRGKSSFRHERGVTTMRREVLLRVSFQLYSLSNPFCGSSDSEFTDGQIKSFFPMFIRD